MSRMSSLSLTSLKKKNIFENVSDPILHYRRSMRKQIKQAAFIFIFRSY